MKYLCDCCNRLVPASKFSVRDGVLSLLCPECGAESLAEGPRALPIARPVSALELASSARAVPPHSVDARCPKCGAPKTGEGRSCSRCGLIFARFKPENLSLSQNLELLWSRAESSWASVDLHNSFVKACSESSDGALAEAVRRYRVRSEQNPSDPIATRFRDEASSRLIAGAKLPARADDSIVNKNAFFATALVIFGLLVATAIGVMSLAKGNPIFFDRFFPSIRSATKLDSP